MLTEKVLKCGAIVVACLSIASCGGGNKDAGRDKGAGGAGKKIVISDSGSDTMVNLAQMWAEAYREAAPDVSVEVAGGGSGVGIRDLTQGIISIANSSRDMEDSEREQAVRTTGKEPVKWVVGYDGLSIYVHKDNPVDTLTLEDLAAIYGENGKIEKWSQLGINMSALGANDEIVRVSRQNSSGTYAYFREKVLDKKDFKLGSKDMSGSKDVVELVKRAKGAIGCSGMGYLSEGVKAVKIAARKGEQAYPPSVDNVLSGKYPLSRSLIMYTLGQPEGPVKAYIEWVLSPAGQAIVENAGYVPLGMSGKAKTM
jgi:phosphate transport system substrate-binding protein